MPDYSQGKIYCIRAPGTDDIYIGSTTQPLCVRMAQHRRQHKLWSTGAKPYCSSFQLIECDQAYIELLEAYPCDNKEQLTRREGELVRGTAACINHRIPGRTLKEYKKDNKEKIREQHKEYQRDYLRNNREHINERKRMYRQAKRAAKVDATRSTGAETEVGTSAEASTIVESRHD